MGKYFVDCVKVVYQNQAALDADVIPRENSGFTPWIVTVAPTTGVITVWWQPSPTP